MRAAAAAPRPAKPRNVPASTMTALESQEIDSAVAHVEQMLSQTGQIDRGAAYRLLSIAVRLQAVPPKHQRPDIIDPQLMRCVYMEMGQSKRRNDSRRGPGGAAAEQMDRWVNGGGKRAVVRLDTGCGHVLERRAGKITRSDGGDGDDLRYHQYSIAAEGGKRSRATTMLYHVFHKPENTRAAPRPDEKDSPHGAAGADPPPDNGRPKRRRVMTPAAKAAAAGTGMLAVIGTVALMSSIGLSPFGPVDNEVRFNPILI